MTYYDEDEIVLPKEFLNKHNLCIHLHDVCLTIFFECMEGNRLKGLQIEENGRKSLKEMGEGENAIDWLIKNDYKKEANILLKRSIFHSLVGDFLSFVLESLKASEKGKTAISYTLLRKPFKDNLFYLEWLNTNGDELLSLVESGSIEKYEVGMMRKKQNKKMRNILIDSYNKNEYKSYLMFEKNLMYQLRYDYNAPFSLELMWNKANHLVTTARTIRTVDFNNLFLTEEDYYERWDYYYSKLPHLLLYSMGVIINLYEELFEKISDSSKTYNNILLSTKWFYNLDPEEGRDFLNDLLEGGNFPLICEECNKITLIDKTRYEEIQNDWFIKCDNCDDFISISKYYFIDDSGD